MAREIHQIVYVSKASHPMSPAELAEILRLARHCNQVQDITGMLLYRNGYF